MQQKNRIHEVKKILDNIVKKLRVDYDPEQIILFGSYAYGNSSDESDIDLLIVKDTNESVLERWVRVRKMVSELRKGFAFSPIIVTPEELETRLEKGDHFFDEIIRRGKNLYARD